MIINPLSDTRAGDKNTIQNICQQESFYHLDLKNQEYKKTTKSELNCEIRANQKCIFSDVCSTNTTIIWKII